MGAGGVLLGQHCRICAAALVLFAIGLLFGGCGGSDSSATSDSDAAKKKPASTVAETEEAEPPEPGSAVSTGAPTSAGTIVVDGTGFTLYHFSKDKRDSGKSACYGRCEKIWLPYLTHNQPRVVLKARQSELGTIKRKDGFTQITYGGWPVYSHARDGWPLSSRAHEPAGEAAAAGRHQFGGVWYLVKPNGEVVR